METETEGGTSQEELYKVETHSWDGGTTVVIRFERNAGAGLVALEVGKIEPLQPRGTRLLLYAGHQSLVLRAPANQEMDKWVVIFMQNFKRS